LKRTIVVRKEAILIRAAIGDRNESEDAAKQGLARDAIHNPTIGLGLKVLSAACKTREVKLIQGLPPKKWIPAPRDAI